MQVKVWNDNVHAYKENFREKQINIPPKGHILMEYDEAMTFKGTFSAPLRDADGNQIPEGFKMIRVEEPVVTTAQEKQTTFKCHLDGKEFTSEKELNDYIQTNYKDRIVVDAEAEAEMKKKKTAKAS